MNFWGYENLHSEHLRDEKMCIQVNQVPGSERGKQKKTI